MYNSDKHILRLLELLVFEKKIESTNQFFLKIGILRQTISKIKKGRAHFTVLHIESICKNYNVNANWIYGFSDQVYNHPDSIKLINNTIRS